MEYDENVQVRLKNNTTMEYLITKLQFNYSKFKKRIPEHSAFNIKNDTDFEFVVRDKVLASGKWDLLGVYKVLPNDNSLFNWCWHLMPEEEKQKSLKQKLIEKLDKHPELLEGGQIMSDDIMMLTNLMAILSHYVGYDHIYVVFSDNVFKMFGFYELKYIKLTKTQKKKYLKI